MDFYFYDPFDDLCKFQARLAQLQDEVCQAQQKRSCSVKKNSKKGDDVDKTLTSESTCCCPCKKEEDEEEEGESMWWPAVDVRETESGYELHVELPGVKKEDVKIELHKEGSGKLLVVSGTKERIVRTVPEEEKKADKEEEEEKGKEEDSEEKMEDNETKKEGGEEQKPEEAKEDKKTWEKWHMTERVFGSFERAFRVPVETEAEEIKAKFENGVLVVAFPKHEPALAAPAKVAIKID